MTPVPTRTAPAMSSEGITRDFDSDAIKQMLPHRWPMLMIDRAHDVIPGERGRGVKNVSINEPFFAGHYPNHSIMPGVLIIESLAQLVAVIYVAERLEVAPEVSVQDVQASVGYLGSISKMKFSRLVRPGDQLDLEAVLGPRLGGLREAAVTAHVGRNVVANGTLIVTSTR